MDQGVQQHEHEEPNSRKGLTQQPGSKHGCHRRLQRRRYPLHSSCLLRPVSQRKSDLQSSSELAMQL